MKRKMHIIKKAWHSCCHMRHILLSLTGKQRDQGSSLPRSKQRKKTTSSTSFSATHPQTTSMKKQTRTFTTNCDIVKEKDITILMGDLSANIGSDNSGNEEVLGRQELGKMNENGEKLADLCAFNNMIIGGSVFPHRRIHKATWVSPDHRT